MRWNQMLVLNLQRCNRLSGHMSVLCVGSGCLGLGLEQESNAVTGLGVGRFCDLLVMSATGTQEGRLGVTCAVLPGELYAEYRKTRFHSVLKVGLAIPIF